MLRSLYVVAALLVSACVFSTRIAAQESRGNITGSVVNPQGSAIARLRIEGRNVDTGVSTPATTNESGLFAIEFLIPGHYSITADAPGFKKLVRPDLTLSIAGRLQLDLKMEVGAVSDTVTVTGGTPPLETTNASIGRVVEPMELAEMPVAQTNPINMANLAPGVINVNLSKTTVSLGMAGTPNIEPWEAWAITSNTLDGLPITGTGGQPGFTPSSDMVDELKLQTTTFDTQNGFSAGVVMNLTTRAGTNQYHGIALR